MLLAILKCCINNQKCRFATISKQDWVAYFDFVWCIWYWMVLFYLLSLLNDLVIILAPEQVLGILTWTWCNEKLSNIPSFDQVCYSSWYTRYIYIFIVMFWKPHWMVHERLAGAWIGGEHHMLISSATLFKKHSVNQNVVSNLVSLVRTMSKKNQFFLFDCSP